MASLYSKGLVALQYHGTSRAKKYENQDKLESIIEIISKLSYSSWKKIGLGTSDIPAMKNVIDLRKSFEKLLLKEK